jgi:CheY-like chemotaxis protein
MSEESRATADLVAAIGHELRTPMAGVIGMAEILLETDLTANQRAYASIVRREADALLATINDVVDLARLEAGQLRLEEAAVDLRAIVQEAAEKLQQASGSKPVELRADVAADVPAAIRGDGARIGQALRCLGENAVVLAERGEIAIAVERQSHLAERSSVVFRITLTGPTVAIEVLHRLMEPTAAAERPAAYRYTGAGRRVAVARGLVALMGGAHGVEATSATALTCWFTVPLVQPMADPSEATMAARRTAARAAEVGSLAAPAGEGAGESAAPLILLAEDYPDTQRLATILLERLGYRVKLAASGEEVLANYERDPTAYALLLLDANLPGVDGLATARAIRRAERETGRRLPIIALSASGEAEDRARYREAGMDDYLGKPISRTELRDALARWVAPKVIPR